MSHFYCKFCAKHMSECRGECQQAAMIQNSEDQKIHAETTRDLLEELAATSKTVEIMREALEELADLMDDVRAGEYKPDSFTTQPAREALSKCGGGAGISLDG